MQSLIVSMVRFSAALALFSLEQLQSTLSTSRERQDVSTAVEGVQGALNSMSDVLADGLDSGKKETLRSVTSLAEEVVHRSADSLDLADPRELLRAAGELVHRSSEAVSDWIGKPESRESDEPQAAADVLAAG